MNSKVLGHYFHLHRRYSRSINLERDFDHLETLEGYVLTERAESTLQRIVMAWGQSSDSRAWTLTGNYGTGKSAFAQYLAALSRPQNSPEREIALAIARQCLGTNTNELKNLEQNLPLDGLWLGIATGRREPLSHTIIRALSQGADLCWANSNRPSVALELTDWAVEIDTSRSIQQKVEISDKQVLDLLHRVLEESQKDLFLVIDELGKNLEFTAQHQGTRDLYLLQQIAEFKTKPKSSKNKSSRIFLLGLLHQSFAGYSDRLATIEQSEWAKVQGRFEDISFTESPNQMTRLIGQAIDRSKADSILCAVREQASTWQSTLKTALGEYDLSESMIAEAYPLHPITAIVLPLLCTRYAQNDRSLFTFLTSDEPHGFCEFLRQTIVFNYSLPTFTLDRLYDYFVESVSGLASRVNLQRWVEVQSLIQDARDRDPDLLRLLKTIGVLNLATTTGTLRARPELVALALCDRPDDSSEQAIWLERINRLQEQGIITYRRQLDELRIWQGSDFDVEGAIYKQVEQDRLPLAKSLATVRPLKPVVAQRHLHDTGNLRYFEQCYGDTTTNWQRLGCSFSASDGLVLYWIDETLPQNVPAKTADGKPLIVVEVAKVDLLRTRAREVKALQQVNKAPELTSDSVARHEVRYRLQEAERLLDDTMLLALGWAGEQLTCWILGERKQVQNIQAFRAAVSDVCDRTYDKAWQLDNELINRRELTTQGAKARRLLIEAMLSHASAPRLGLTGYGPEVAMYYSVLDSTGIHRQEQGLWGFFPPLENSGLVTVWKAIEQFCCAAVTERRSLADLYIQLEQPPYGLKRGAIPVVLAAILLHRAEDFAVYKDDGFVAVLGPEHFELLVKDPARFSVKYFELLGLRSVVFRELEVALRSKRAEPLPGVRNFSLLAIAKPLFSFVKQLNKYVLQTRHISPEAQQVLQVLQQAQEPDEVLFTALPKACGLQPIAAGVAADEDMAREFKRALVACLRELNVAYDRLLERCQTCLLEALGVRGEARYLREDIRVRSRHLLPGCLEPTLKRFLKAAVDESLDDRAWLEALTMVVADKPPRSWTDDDAVQFEVKLSDLARRFKNLEAVQSSTEAQREGFEAVRLTITRTDGREVNQVVWVDRRESEVLDRLIAEILQNSGLSDNSRLQQALLARLGERVLSPEENDQVAKARKKRHNLPHEQSETS